MITHVQLMATVQVDMETTRPATDDEIEHEACLYSVYIGEPGDFSWVADFAEHADAAMFAQERCTHYDAKLILGRA